MSHSRRSMGSTGVPSTSAPASRRRSTSSPRPSSPSRDGDWRSTMRRSARVSYGAMPWRWTKRSDGSSGARASPSRTVSGGRCNPSGRTESVLLQVGRAIPTTPWELVLTSSRETKFVLAILVVFSLVSWYLIALKWWQFRRMRQQADRFMTEIERAARLEDAYHAAMRLPSSPYNRLLREGMQFFSELKPGSMKGGGKSDGPVVATPATTLTTTQLEALRMVLAAERDSAARFIPWLATFGSVSPLLGLLGTVLGVMDAFIGIAVGGSGNIGAVAPGVAEALVTTVAGLAVAVPSVMAYNLFVNRLGLFAGELEGFAQEIIGTLAREGRL